MLVSARRATPSSPTVAWRPLQTPWRSTRWRCVSGTLSCQSSVRLCNSTTRTSWRTCYGRIWRRHARAGPTTLPRVSITCWSSESSGVSTRCRNWSVSVASSWTRSTRRQTVHSSAAATSCCVRDTPVTGRRWTSGAQCRRDRRSDCATTVSASSRHTRRPCRPTACWPSTVALVLEKNESAQVSLRWALRDQRETSPSCIIIGLDLSDYTVENIGKFVLFVYNQIQPFTMTFICCLSWP